MIFSIITYCFVALYVIVVAVFVFGWFKMPYFAPKTHSTAGITLVVCCRNEEQNLPQLFQTLLAQTHSNFEVIFANDHSTDSTPKLLDEFGKKCSFARWFSTTKQGKKNALREAIFQARFDVVACTDADCLLQPNYLQTISDYFAAHNPDLLVGAVRMQSGVSLFTQLQALEFASLVASTAGACGAGMPIMCNGANLAFKKSVWMAHNTQLCDTELSGDDMFMLHAVKRSGGTIGYLKNADAIVDTLPQTTLKEFFGQRGRWVSKSGSYTDWTTIFVAVVVLLANLSILGGFIGIFWSKTLVLPFVICFGSKFVADFAILSAFLPFLSQKRLILHAPLLSVVYPFYVIISILVGLFRRKW